jgi:hypothetical protein
MLDGKSFGSPLAFIEGGTQNRSRGKGRRGEILCAEWY